MQKWDSAIAAGEKAVKLAPNNSEYHMWLGRAYGEKADHASFVTAAQLTKKIRQEFERAVELDASNVKARSDLAEFYIEAPAFMGGGKNKARREAEAIAQRNAAIGHWLQARIAEKDERFDVAEQEYKTAIQVSGNQGSYWLNLASYYKRRHRLSEMESAITQAIEADKKPPNVLFDAAQILFAAGRNFVGRGELRAQVPGQRCGGGRSAGLPGALPAGIDPGEAGRQGGGGGGIPGRAGAGQRLRSGARGAEPAGQEIA